MGVRNTVPFEVIGGAAIQFYWAPVGTAFPSLDTDLVASPGLWTLIGESGDLNYDGGGGIEVAHPQNMSKWRAYGESGVRKVFRQEEDLTFKVKVVDLTLETYSLALNGNVVTTVPSSGPGVSGYKKIGLARGLDVDTKAVLIRLLASPYGQDWVGQYEFPRAAQTGSPVVQFMKAEPCGLELQWDSLVDNDATENDERLGRLLFQIEDAAT